MKLALAFLCSIGIAGANYGAPQGGQGYYPIGGVYYESDSDSREEIRKLSELDGPGIFKAQIKYYHNKHGDYALITCKPNPLPNHFTWIMTNAGKDLQGFPVNIPGAIPLAGGINITYMAKYGRDGKWKGEDYLYSEKRKFRRVGCLFSTDQSVDIEREK
ncbi:hypothetical protein CAEBREN_00532 [Caenorhabditis brenneri]|uniref:Uncharacterized protein n=1 Tax=Caenorhabditis brenneri TaxID=135651 RepID=G0NT14_CAEBE|nr:hypothetical protein CAEBREN_00532 [Caenorhabditis brenneri]